ncbi:MAG: zinc transporter ZntB [Proteobacteria bacterium]|nr:zinc transporter ZntB [Pseudomonadota bacterium]
MAGPEHPPQVDGLICAYLLDGKGGGRRLDWDEVRAWKPEEGMVWIHLDRTAPGARRWIEEESGLDRLAADAMLTEETRPRSERLDADTLLLLLRGVNLNPGERPDDMISVRFWATERRVITTRRYHLMAIQDLRSAIEAGKGPVDIGGVISRVALSLSERMFPVVSDLDDRLDELEEAFAAEVETEKLRDSLGPLRRQAISLRRHMAPQREALSRLQAESMAWIDPLDRAHLREAADAVTRYVEDLDAMRERAGVLRDEAMSHLSERLNRNMYVLSIVATIMLPLSLVTGLLGINVDGIPGSSWPWAFAFVCGLLAVLGVVEYWLFRRLRWI